MILYKKDFTQEKYNDLVNYANTNNSYIEDKGEFYETVEIEVCIPTLDELKELKKQELKQKRDEYKINSGFSSFVFENLEFGLIQNIEDEKEKWETFLKDLIKKYDEYKNQINNSSSKEELDLIIIEF